MKKYFLILFLFAGCIISISHADASSVASRLSGRILLQVQSHGEGWYVNPTDLQRYYLGRPDDAFSVMRQTGVGITNADLARISVSTSSATGDRTFANKMSGRILLQVQSKGEAWYVYPTTLKRHYLGRPADAFSVMRTLGLGVTDNDLGAILSKSSTSVSGNTFTICSTPCSVATHNANEAARTTIIADLNKQRVAQGLPSVKASTLLSTAAQAHADDMTTQGYFSLTSPSGTKVSDRVFDAGYKAQSVGLWLDSSSAGASDIVAKWKSGSASDFSSVALNKDLKEAGVGVAQVDGQPTFIIILAVSQDDYLKDFTAALADMTKVRNDMLARVNAERKKAGVAPLVLNTNQTGQNVGIEALAYNDLLNTAAQKHADDMRTKGYYSHTSLDGSTIADRVTAQGYHYSAVGENIAKGQRTVQEVMDDWMASQGHRENILNSTYTDFGMGLSFGQNKNGYEILWTQAFGKSK